MSTGDFVYFEGDLAKEVGLPREDLRKARLGILYVAGEYGPIDEPEPSRPELRGGVHFLGGAPGQRVLYSAAGAKMLLDALFPNTTGLPDLWAKIEKTARPGAGDGAERARKVEVTVLRKLHNNSKAVMAWRGYGMRPASSNKPEVVVRVQDAKPFLVGMVLRVVPANSSGTVFDYVGPLPRNGRLLQRGARS